MVYLKVKNIVQSDGNIDYKGLDINEFKPFSQMYDLYNSNACVLQTAQIGIPQHPDIEVIDEVEYNNFKEMLANRPKPKTELELLKIEIEATQQAMDFLIMNGGM